MIRKFVNREQVLDRLAKKSDANFRVIIKQDGKDGQTQEMVTRIKGDQLLEFLQDSGEFCLAGLALLDRCYDLVTVRDEMIVGFGLERKCFLVDCKNIAEHRHHGVITKAMVRGVTMTRDLRLVIDGRKNLFPLCAQCHEGRGHISRDELFRNHCRRVGYEKAVEHWESVLTKGDQFTKVRFRRVDYQRFQDVQAVESGDDFPI